MRAACPCRDLEPGVPRKEQWFRGHRCRNVFYLSNKHCEGEEGTRAGEPAPVQKQDFWGVPSVPAGQGSQRAKLQEMRFLGDQCQVIQEAITVSHMRSGSVNGWPAM